MICLMVKGFVFKGINVNVVVFGLVVMELFFEGKLEFVINGIKSMNFYGKLGEMGDIVKVVGFLVGEESVWVDG